MTLLDERKAAAQPEDISVLIPEARRRTRLRRLFIAVVIIVVVAACAAVAAQPTHRTPPVAKQATAPKLPPLIPVAVGESLPSSTVMGLSMLTTTSGYGVASTQWDNWSGRPRNSFITFTGNSGSSWKVVAPLPTVLWGPLVTFVSPTVGYVAGTQQAKSLFVTTDGGHQWRAVSVAGEPLTLTSSGSTVWVTSQVCVPGDNGATSMCPTTLSVFHAGATTPSRAGGIPTDRVVLNTLSKIDVTQPPMAISTQLLAQYGPMSGLASQGGDSPNVLVQTTNGGQTWRTIATPCFTKGRILARVVTAFTWYLFCSQDGGMEQGNDYMYRTSDAGQSWHLLAQGHIQGLNTNGLRDNVPAVVGSNASGSVVWFSDITGVIVTSANSGQTWHYRYEGRLLAPQWTSQGFDTVGNSVFEASPYGGVLHSTNGLTWSYIGKVRQAP
jgi:photosystem II stability/assembly factor-like uncharacterized protein